MGERKVTILETVVSEVAEIAFFLEGLGLPDTAKRFVDDAFHFFETLANKRGTHRPCSYPEWAERNYRCVNFKKKYVVAYLALSEEIVICDFVLQKLLH